MFSAPVIDNDSDDDDDNNLGVRIASFSQFTRMPSLAFSSNSTAISENPHISSTSFVLPSPANMAVTTISSSSLMHRGTSSFYHAHQSISAALSINMLSSNGHTASRFLVQQHDGTENDPWMNDQTDEIDYNSPEHQIKTFMEGIGCVIDEEATLSANKATFITKFEEQLAKTDITADFLTLLANYMLDVQAGKMPQDTYFNLIRTETNYIRGLFSEHGETTSWCKLQLIVKDELMQRFCENNLDASTDHPADKIYLEKEQYDELYKIFNAQRGRWPIPFLEARHAEKFRLKFEVSPQVQMRRV